MSKFVKIKKKFIMWQNPDQRLIRLKNSYGYGNYLLEVKKPFKRQFFGLTIEEVTFRFREANKIYWANATFDQVEKKATKRKKRK